MTTKLLIICYEMFKTGMFSVGGGLATLPFLKRIGETYGWFTYPELMNMLAISESTPGPIGINMATYMGFTTAGIPGALCATLSEVAPALFIITFIYRMLNRFKENRYVGYAFYGLRPASTGLIAGALIAVTLEVFTSLKLVPGLLGGHMNVLRIGEGPFLSLKAVLLAVLIYVLTNRVKQTKGLHPIVFIGISALCGIVFRFAGA